MNIVFTLTTGQMYSFCAENLIELINRDEIHTTSKLQNPHSISSFSLHIQNNKTRLISNSHYFKLKQTSLTEFNSLSGLKLNLLQLM